MIRVSQSNDGNTIRTRICGYCGNEFSYEAEVRKLGRPRETCDECLSPELVAQRRKEKDKARYAASSRPKVPPPTRTLEEMRSTGLFHEEREWLRQQLAKVYKRRAIREERLNRDLVL
jgi:hypothetical protein